MGMAIFEIMEELAERLIKSSTRAAPLGVIGSFVQELLPETADFFRFKHHYILNALDNEVLCDLALAISESRLTELSGSSQRRLVLPIRFYISTQTGRQYVLCWSPQTTRFSFWRLDLLDRVIRRSVPAGTNVRETPHPLAAMIDLSELRRGDAVYRHRASLSQIVLTAEVVNKDSGGVSLQGGHISFISESVRTALPVFHHNNTIP